MGCNQVFDWINSDFAFLYFFLKPGLVLAPDQPGPGPVSKL
jgi:hypothetical protein